MEIYLTEEELKREKSLITPHEVKYKLLTGRTYEIREFVQDIETDKDKLKPPPSC